MYQRLVTIGNCFQQQATWMFSYLKNGTRAGFAGLAESQGKRLRARFPKSFGRPKLSGVGPSQPESD